MKDQRNGLLIGIAAGVGACWAGRALVHAARWFDLRGKTVLVTGGSRGLGLLLAKEFAGRQANVAICARDAEELERAKQQLRNEGLEVVPYVCDVTIREQVENLIRQVEQLFGGLNVLVNNAGTISMGPMEVMNLADYEEAMKIHFWGPLHAVMSALPSMKSRGGGRIVNITSIGGKISVPHLLPYCASKFALVGFSEGLRAELKKNNIYVTTICPGLMRTGSPRNAFFKGRHREEYAWFSVSDSLPLTSMSARRAARRVVRACQRGESEVILSIQAKLAAKFHGLFPGVTTEIGSLINAMLPSAGGIGQQRARGSESASAVTQSFLTELTQRAARANNEVV